MNKTNRLTLIAAMALPVLLSAGASYAAPTHVPENFADEAFKNVWTRTDALVDNGSVKRSYYWGPIPGFTTSEDYAEGPNGKHLVQYFDKSRMEINNPNGDKTNPFYVTNGLLTNELITGRMQVGNNAFVDRYPAEINIASDGDDKNAPTYASFRGPIYSPMGSTRIGETIVDTINRDGFVGSDTTYSSYNVKYAFYEAATKHNIPDQFWTFLNNTGPVMKDGKVVSARLNDPYFYATGYPIAEAYWANVKIAGVANTAVLIQPYERRVLTYVPTAPDGFKVQMGNIGQHYYAWRYSEAGKPQPPAIRCQQVPLRGFGKLWADHPELQAKIGCTYEQESIVTVAQQNFEHGQMLDVIGNYGYYGSGYKTIYVLFDDGTTRSFPDNYVDGSPEPSITAPSGLYVPQRGFGKVWREGTGARVRERLGWATTPETVAVGQLPIVPGPVPTTAPVGPTPTLVPPGLGGAVQRFDRGLMIYAGPTLKKIYVLYTQQGYGPYDIDHWEVYNDTFQEP
ncbi:MAG: hypothetical protein ABI670_17175 [Chloroflexota bacterium]